MTDIKAKVQNVDSNVTARDLNDMSQRMNGNIYEAIAIITKRAKQLSVEIKQELHQKLEDFAATSDNIEEVHENKEQIEISKFYERMPNPSIIATNEFLNNELYHRYLDKSEHPDIEED